MNIESACDFHSQSNVAQLRSPLAGGCIGFFMCTTSSANSTGELNSESTSALDGRCTGVL